MKTNQASADSESPDLEVIWFLKLHDDTIDVAQYCRERFHNSATGESYYLNIYKVEAKSRPGVVLQSVPNRRRSRVWSLGSETANSERLGTISGLNGSSFLRCFPWEIIWVPNNLVVEWRAGRLSRPQTKMVLDKWRELEGFAPSSTPHRR